MTISRPSSSISARTASIATRRPRPSAAPTGPCSTSPSRRWCAGSARSSASPPRRSGRPAIRTAARSTCSNGRRSTPAWRDEALGAKWDVIRATRERVTECIEPLRRDKVIGSSLEARIAYPDLELGLDRRGPCRPCRNLHRVRSRAGRGRGDRSDADRLSEMRPLLAASAGGRRGWRPVRALRGGGEWLRPAGKPAPRPPRAILRLKRNRAARARARLPRLRLRSGDEMGGDLSAPPRASPPGDRDLLLLRSALGRESRRLARPAHRRTASSAAGCWSR